MTGPGAVELREFPRPEPEPGAVVLDMRLSGICGTDKHTFRGETLQYAGTPHEREIGYPLICGHENVGVIAAIGGADAVPDGAGRPLRVGDRVVPAANVTCGRCWYCLSGQPYYLCERMEDYGNSLGCAEPPYLFGGWSEQMYLLPGTALFRVPDAVPDELAVLTEPLAVTHGIDTARRLREPPFGESVVVFGVGPLGLCHLIKARLLGCGRLIAIDLLPSRLALAEDLGATLTLRADELEPDQLAEQVRAHTDGRGADLVIDASGVPQTFPSCLRLVRTGGVLVEAGAFVDLGPVGVNPAADICTRNVTVLGIGGELLSGYAPALELLARHHDRLPLDRIVTHRLPLRQAKQAIELAQRDGAMKVVLGGR